MFLIQQNNPFAKEHAPKVEFIKKLYDVIDSESPIKKTAESFLWLWINQDAIEAAFAAYCQFRNDNPDLNPEEDEQQNHIAALGDGHGMPIHMEGFATLEDLQAWYKRITENLAYSITWAVKEGRLFELSGTLSTGCCLESRSRELLMWVQTEQGLIPKKINDLIADRMKSFEGDSEEDILLHFAKLIGVKASPPEKKHEQKEEKDKADSFFVTPELILEKVKEYGLYNGKVYDASQKREVFILDTIQERYKAFFSKLYVFRVSFLDAPEVKALHQATIKWLLDQFALTEEAIRFIATRLTEDEIDLTLNACMTDVRIDLCEKFIKYYPGNIPGNGCNKNNDTALMKLIRHITPATKATALPVISALLQKKVDLYTRNSEEGLSAAAYALVKEAEHPDLDLSESIFKEAKSSEDLRGSVLLELSERLPATIQSVRKLLISPHPIKLKHEKGMSPVFYLMRNDIQNVNGDAGLLLVVLFFTKIKSPQVFGDAIIAAQALQQWDHISGWLNLAEETHLFLAEEGSTFEKDQYYRSLANALILFIYNNLIQQQFSEKTKKALDIAFLLYQRISARTADDEERINQIYILRWDRVAIQFQETLDTKDLKKIDAIFDPWVETFSRISMFTAETHKNFHNALLIHYNTFARYYNFKGTQEKNSQLEADYFQKALAVSREMRMLAQYQDPNAVALLCDNIEETANRHLGGFYFEGAEREENELDQRLEFYRLALSYFTMIPPQRKTPADHALIKNIQKKATHMAILLFERKKKLTPDFFLNPELETYIKARLKAQTLSKDVASDFLEVAALHRLFPLNTFFPFDPLHESDFAREAYRQKAMNLFASNGSPLFLSEEQFRHFLSLVARLPAEEQIYFEFRASPSQVNEGYSSQLINNHMLLEGSNKTTFIYLPNKVREAFLTARFREEYVLPTLPYSFFEEKGEVKQHSLIERADIFQESIILSSIPNTCLTLLKAFSALVKRDLLETSRETEEWENPTSFLFFYHLLLNNTPPNEEKNTPQKRMNDFCCMLTYATRVMTPLNGGYLTHRGELLPLGALIFIDIAENPEKWNQLGLYPEHFTGIFSKLYNLVKQIAPSLKASSLKVKILKCLIYQKLASMNAVDKFDSIATMIDRSSKELENRLQFKKVKKLNPAVPEEEPFFISNEWNGRVYFTLDHVPLNGFSLPFLIQAPALALEGVFVFFDFNQKDNGWMQKPHLVGQLAHYLLIYSFEYYLCIRLNILPRNAASLPLFLPNFDLHKKYILPNYRHFHPYLLIAVSEVDIECFLSLPKKKQDFIIKYIVPDLKKFVTALQKRVDGIFEMDLTLLNELVNSFDTLMQFAENARLPFHIFFDEIFSKADPALRTVLLNHAGYVSYLMKNNIPITLLFDLNETSLRQLFYYRYSVAFLIKKGITADSFFRCDLETRLELIHYAHFLKPGITIAEFNAMSKEQKMALIQTNRLLAPKPVFIRQPANKALEEKKQETTENALLNLHLIAENGHLADAKTLLKHGADPFRAYRGITPFSLAIANQHFKVARLFIEHKLQKYKTFPSSLQLAWDMHPKSVAKRCFAVLDVRLSKHQEQTLFSASDLQKEAAFLNRLKQSLVAKVEELNFTHPEHFKTLYQLVHELLVDALMKGDLPFNSGLIRNCIFIEDALCKEYGKNQHIPFPVVKRIYFL